MKREEKTYSANTLDDLLKTLQGIKDSGYDMSEKWMGWDDGNIYVQPFKKEIWITIDSGGSYT